MIDVDAARDVTLEFNARLRAIFGQAAGRPIKDIDVNCPIPGDLPENLEVLMENEGWLICRTGSTYLVVDGMDGDADLEISSLEESFDSDSFEEFIEDMFTEDPAWAYYGSITDPQLESELNKLFGSGDDDDD